MFLDLEAARQVIQLVIRAGDQRHIGTLPAQSIGHLISEVDQPPLRVRLDDGDSLAHHPCPAISWR